MAPPSTPSRYPSMDMFDEIVKVRVGKEPNIKTFSIHKGIASFYSGYFEGATQDCFLEGQTGMIELPTETVTVFERFTKWLYTRQWDRLNKDVEAEDFRLICEVWIFADRRQIPLLMNDMITEMRVEVLRLWRVPTKQLTFIYYNTTPTAELRRYVINLIAYTSGDTSTERSDWPHEAVWDILKLVWGKDTSVRLKPAAVAAEDLCVYHRHEEGVKCKEL